MTDIFNKYIPLAVHMLCSRGDNIMMKYPIFDGTKQVGEAVAKKEGMYRVLECFCLPLSGKPERLRIRVGESDLSLGLCVPEGNSMRAIKRIPEKAFGLGEPYIYLEKEHTREIRFESGLPFEDIQFLRKARLGLCDGKYYLLIPESSKPTGQ